MQSILKLISQANTSQASEMGAVSESFWDPGSIALCTAGCCMLVVWLFWFEGFGALRNTPTRRHHRFLALWSLVILFGWFLSMPLVLEMTSNGKSTQEALVYALNAAVELVLIAGMLTIASRLFARRLKGFGLDRQKIFHHAKWGTVNLLAIFPLMLFGLWITLTLGQLFKGDQFALEKHASLSILSEAGFGLRFMVIVFAVVIVPVFEELLFRGFFQTSLRSLSGRPWVGVVLTSIFFAILHPPTHIVPLFIFSCGLGYAYERSGSLWRPILMHIFFNGFNVTVTLFVAG